MTKDYQRTSEATEIKFEDINEAIEDMKLQLKQAAARSSGMRVLTPV